MSPERLRLYLENLSDLTEFQICYAFDRALKSAKFIPAIGELREWATEGAREQHQRLTAERNQKLLDRPDKPDDWTTGRLDSVWEEIERRADAQELQDLAHVEQFSDEEIDRIMKLGHPFPGPGRYVDWVRRKEARDRRAKGIPRPRTRKQYGQLFETILSAAREPGSDDE